MCHLTPVSFLTLQQNRSLKKNDNEARIGSLYTFTIQSGGTLKWIYAQTTNVEMLTYSYQAVNGL